MKKILLTFGSANLAAAAATTSTPPVVALGRLRTATSDYRRQQFLTMGANAIRNLSSSSVGANTSRMNVHSLRTAIGITGAVVTTMYMLYNHHQKGLLTQDTYSPNNEAARITERCQKYGLVERKITPDGNCQFRALADQIMEDQNRYAEVRTRIIDWLKRNERYAVDDNNTACLGDFLDREQYPSWDNYCKYMSGNRAWGDHLTLVAATEAFGVNLWVLSSLDVADAPPVNGLDQYITTLSPRIATPIKTARLAHYHELHYTSLHPKDPLSTVPIKAEASAEPA
jgi:hypothetical protein